MLTIETENWPLIREHLLTAVRCGDQAAMRSFYDEHLPGVYRYVLCRMEGNHTETEEVVQDVFFHTFKDLAAYDGKHPIQMWILGIARHRIIDHCRRAGRRPVVELLFSQFDEEFSRRLFDLESEELPDSEMERSELAIVVELVLSQLPKQYEQVLRLRYLEEKPVKELALELRTTPKAAEALLFRARNTFRDAFKVAGGNLAL